MTLQQLDAPANDLERDLPALPVESHTLSNGLRLVLHVDRRLPVVHVNSWYHVGARDERPGLTGLAHFCEHLMFDGSKHARGGFMRLVERAGANLAEGAVNATTGHDRTTFFASVPPPSLERVLWLESDRLAHLSGSLSTRRLNTERDVVANEQRQRLDERPYGRADRIVLRHLFPPEHPYNHDVLGAAEDLAAVRMEDVRAFFAEHYVPNNLSLVIAGDFDPSQARRLVEKYYGAIAPGAPRVRLRRWIPELSGLRVIEAGDRSPLPRTYVAWPSPGLFERGDAELDLASHLLAHGMSSRLAAALVHERPLCADVGASQKSMELAGMFFVWATWRQDSPQDEIESVLAGEIARLAADGPRPDELRRAIVNHERRYVSHLDRLGGFGGRGDLLNMYNTYLGRPDAFAADLDRYRRATPDSVRDAVRKWMDPARCVVVRFHPEAAIRSVAPALDRRVPPAIGPSPRFVPPRLECRTLANGMDVIVVERRDVPQVSGLLVTRAGSVCDPPGGEGLANLVLDTLTCGTADRSARAVDGSLGQAGAAIETAVHPEYGALRFTVVTRSLVPCLATLGDIVSRPSFPEADVTAERSRHLERLQQMYGRSWPVAMRVSSAMRFGATHPYGRSPYGRPSAVASIGPEDLAAFHARHWTPRGCALVLVGDISPEAAVSLAADAFGGWSGGDPVSLAPPPASGATGDRVCVVDRPGATQTVAVVVLPGPARRSPHYHALTLANAVWGGSATSRLARNLRGRRGYSYGVRSFLTPYTQDGIWKVAGHVQRDKAVAAVHEIRGELRRLATDKPIGSAELAAARRQCVDGYVHQFESSARIADQVARLWISRLPLDDLSYEVGRLDSLTKADVHGAVRACCCEAGPGGVLLVGDLAAMADAEEQIGSLGRVEALDPEGAPATATLTAI